MSTQLTLFRINYNFILYEAIEKRFSLLRYIKWLLRYIVRVNDIVIATGPYAGFTALHLACMRGKFEMVKFLIEDCKANVNATAQDGTQPLHLAHFSVDKSNQYPILRILLKAGANVDAEFDEKIFLKYTNCKQKWCEDFGERITLLTYAVFNNNEWLTGFLLEHGANYKITSLTNKTLLMLALEKNYFLLVLHQLIEVAERDDKFLNARDNEDMTAIHYILHPKKFGEFRYDADQIESLWTVNALQSTIKNLISQGADKDALVNNDPKTFLLNVAAYRSSLSMLRAMLPLYSSLTHSRALYYATMPVNQLSDRYVHISDGLYDRFYSFQIRNKLDLQRRSCLKLILIDLMIRRTLSLPVPEDEIVLMEKLISTDKIVRDLTDEIKKDIIDGKLKTKIVKIGDESMTMYDFIIQVYDNKKLKKLLQLDPNLRDNYKKFFPGYNYEFDEYYLLMTTARGMNDLVNRIDLLKVLKRVSNLRQHIPLPYECVLDIVEYLTNEDLFNFLKAFFKLNL